MLYDGSGGIDPLKHHLILLVALLFGVPSAWAVQFEPTQASDPSVSRSSDDPYLRVDELPKPVQEVLAEIQRLSTQLEPEIVKFGSRVREEVDQAMKRLREAAKAEKSNVSPESR